MLSRRPSRGCSRPDRLTPPVAPVLAALVMLFASGCADDSPTSPEQPPTPALASQAAAGALSFRQVSAGSDHSCGVTSDGLAYCWGNNFSGQLGNGTTGGPEQCGVWPCSTRPVPVAGGLHFRHVSAGHAHTCGVTTDERAFCWGYNGNGQLGDGTTADHLTPAAVAGGRHFRQVRAGANHTCAITPFDVAFCWGANFAGQLGDGTLTERPLPVRVVGGLHWLQLSGGAGFTCGVTTEDRAYCWGNNGNGQIGDGTSGEVVPRPTAVVGGLRFRQIDAGGSHTCGVTTADRAYCWGFGGLGQLGDGTTPGTRRRPAAIAGTRRFDHVNAGLDHTCGVTLAGRGFCWGANTAGQLGDGTTANRLTPVPVAGGLTLAQVSAGQHHTCGVITEDHIFCWGDNTYGQLGDGSTTGSPTPVAVADAM
jgi:alpha-tubulin suppressor-like RCC1 family protein